MAGLAAFYQVGIQQESESMNVSGLRFKAADVSSPFVTVMENQHSPEGSLALEMLPSTFCITVRMIRSSATRETSASPRIVLRDCFALQRFFRNMAILLSFKALLYGAEAKHSQCKQSFELF